MPLHPKQVQLVQSSFAQVKPASDAAASLFYNRLFEIAPELRPLFHGDVTEQGRKLMTMIGFVVNGLDRFESISALVRDVGARHARYGVEPGHYDIVAQALLWTLAQKLGPAFTPDVEAAWVSAYTELAETMKSGAARTASAGA